MLTKHSQRWLQPKIYHNESLEEGQDAAPLNKDLLMKEVSFTQTVSFQGKMYLRGKQVVLDDGALAALAGRYTVVKEVQSTAMLEPSETTVMHSPEPKKRRRRKKKVVTNATTS